MNVSYKMFYVSILLLYNTLQAATPLVDTIVYEALWELYGTGCFLGSAATQLRWCYRPNYHFVRYKCLVVTVKKVIKIGLLYVKLCLYKENTHFFGPPCV